MIQKKTIVLAVVLIAIVIIQLNDGLTRKEVRERFRCALRKRRSTNNGRITTRRATTVTTDITTLTSTLTTIFDGPLKIEQACNKGNLTKEFLDRIISKYLNNIR